VNGGGVTENGKVTNTVHAAAAAASAIAPVELLARRTLMEVVPAGSDSSFGAPQTVGSLSGVSLTQPVTNGAWLLAPALSSLQVSSTLVPLADLASQGLVVQLSTVMGSPDGGQSVPVMQPAEGTWFSPQAASYQGTSGSCSALFLSADATLSCKTTQ